AAGDATSANGAIQVWIKGLESVAPCDPCASLGARDLYLSPALDWVNDTALLGSDLSQTLQYIYQNRSPSPSQFYISLVPSVGNPSFDHELPYSSVAFPDAGYQLLALFRFWNMVQYFYPNRDIMSDDPTDMNYWNQVLLDSIPAIGLAPNSLAYKQEMLR